MYGEGNMLLVVKLAPCNVAQFLFRALAARVIKRPYRLKKAFPIKFTEQAETKIGTSVKYSFIAEKNSFE